VAEGRDRAHVNSSSAAILKYSQAVSRTSTVSRPSGGQQFRSRQLQDAATRRRADRRHDRRGPPRGADGRHAADDVLAKPIALKKLVDTVRRFS
jgi:hypothetical protein